MRNFSIWCPRRHLVKIGNPRSYLPSVPHTGEAVMSTLIC